MYQMKKELLSQFGQMGRLEMELEQKIWSFLSGLVGTQMTDMLMKLQEMVMDLNS